MKKENAARKQMQAKERRMYERAGDNKATIEQLKQELEALKQQKKYEDLEHKEEISRLRSKGKMKLAAVQTELQEEKDRM